MDSPGDTDSKQNNTSSTSDGNLAKVEHEITLLRNSQAVQSRSQNVMRDEIKLLQLHLTGLQKVTAKHMDDSIAQKRQTKADLERTEMNMKSMQSVVTELTRTSTQSERQRTDRAWVTPPGAGCSYDSYEQASTPIQQSDDSLDSILTVPVSYPTQCQPSNNFEQRKKQMLATHGIVKTQQKTMMLQIWRAKPGSTENLMQTLLLKMYRFLNKKVNLSYYDPSVGVCDIVIDQIPDYDWLKFVRTELGMVESEIREVKKTCTPTEEQLYQLALEGETED